MSILEAIEARHSVRTFTGSLAPQRQAIVDQIIQEAQNLVVPFGTPVEIGNHEPGLGKLGVISNEAGWILGKIPETCEEPIEKVYADVAYRLHYCVLKLTQYKFASVWVAGTYNRAAAEAHCPGFKIAAGIAYGEDANSIRIIERVMKWAVKSNQRKPMNEMFYNADANCAFNDDNAGDKLALLHAVQWCPSALMVQPWRLYVTGNTYHLYFDSDRDNCRLDMGIALCTMKMFIEGSGKKCEFSVVDNAPVSPLGGSYVMTVTVSD